MSFTDEMQTRGLDPETRVIAARAQAAGEEVAEALELMVASPTLYSNGSASPTESRCCWSRSICQPSAFPAYWPRIWSTPRSTTC